MKKQPLESVRRGEMSRRNFAQAAGLAVTAALVPSSLLAQGEKESKPPIKPMSPAVTETKPLSAEDQAEAKARVEEIFRRYGARLSEEQKADIHHQVLEAQKSLGELRAFTLSNADPPATRLRIRPRSARG